MPSLGHFILSQAATLGGTRSLGRLGGRPTNPAGPTNRSARLAALQRRPLPPHLLAQRPLLREPPLFDLRGLAIGNGLTDPAAQASRRETRLFRLRCPACMRICRCLKGFGS